MKFEENMGRLISEVMTSEGLVTGREGTTLEEAKDILRRHKIEKLPIVDDNFRLKGLITIKDIEKVVKYPNSAKDKHGRLLCAAAIGVTNDILDRAGALVQAGVDALVLDSAHGHSANIMRCVGLVQERLPRGAAHSRQRRHRRGHRSAHQGGRGLRQGRHRPRLHLHDPRRLRHRRAADNCSPRSRRDGATSTASPS